MPASAVVGGQLPQPICSGSLVFLSEGSGLQHSGTESSPFSAPSLRGSDPGSFCSSKDGQCLCRSLCQETWGNSQQVTFEGSLTHAGWAQVNVPYVSAAFIPGSLNLQSDFLSQERVNDNNEWPLHHQVFLDLVERYFLLEVDLFASPQNTKLVEFYLRIPSAKVIACDALKGDWNFRTAYAFPLVPLILNFHRCLRVEKGTVLAVLPYWPNHPWFPLQLQMLIKDPYIIPVRKDPLSQGPLWHPAPEQLCLTAWMLRGASY